MSAFYDRMRATATRLVGRFDQEGTQAVVRQPLLGGLAVVAGSVSGFPGYSDGSVVPAAGSASGYLVAGESVYIAYGLGSSLTVLISGDQTWLSGRGLHINGIVAQNSSASFDPEANASTLQYTGVEPWVVGGEYDLMIGYDPLAPPAYVDSTDPFPAVVRGVSADIAASDPNLVATDLQVICDVSYYSPSADDVVRINGTDRKVIRIEPIPAAGDPCAWRFYVR